MSLSAKQHILKLRETEFKLQKLQNNLVSSGLIDSSSATMSDFLEHHRELMALPGSNRDSTPFRFSFQAPKRYTEMKQPQKLTLPPKIPARSMGRLNPYTTPDSFETDETEKFGQKIGYRSKALHSLLNELEKQTSKMAIAFPKLDKLSLLNKTPFLRGLKNATGYLSSSSKFPKQVKSKKGSSKSSMSSQINSSVPSKLSSKQSIMQSKSKKLKTMWNNQVKETASTAPSELVIPKNDSTSVDSNNNRPFMSPPSPPSPESVATKQNDTELLTENLAYALGSSNLMGVILPTNSTQTKGKGPNTWAERKPTTMSLGKVAGNNSSEVDENDNISAKEAMSILRRRKFPVRKSPLPKHLAPHERGLIGVEISSFEPQCAFFYRDRSGNYNPHLHHSRNVTEGMKKGKVRRNTTIKHTA